MRAEGVQLYSGRCGSAERSARLPTLIAVLPRSSPIFTRAEEVKVLRSAIARAPPRYNELRSAMAPSRLYSA